VLMHTEVYRESRLKRDNTAMNSPDLLDMDK
jgi:hypothetical protein